MSSTEPELALVQGIPFPVSLWVVLRWAERKNREGGREAQKEGGGWEERRVQWRKGDVDFFNVPVLKGLYPQCFPSVMDIWGGVVLWHGFKPLKVSLWRGFWAISCAIFASWAVRWEGYPFCSFLPNLYLSPPQAPSDTAIRSYNKISKIIAGRQCFLF